VQLLYAEAGGAGGASPSSERQQTINNNQQQRAPDLADHSVTGTADSLASLLTQFPLSERKETPSLCQARPPLARARSGATEVGGEEASLVSRRTELLVVHDPIQQILYSNLKSRESCSAKGRSGRDWPRKWASRSARLDGFSLVDEVAPAARECRTGAWQPRRIKLRRAIQCIDVEAGKNEMVWAFGIV
jgi:hypothetical protein